MRIHFAVAALPLVFAAELAAQQPTPQGPPHQPPFREDSAAVMQVVANLFNGMRARDTALMRAMFHPDAPMRSVSWRPSPTGAVAVVQADGIDDWLTGVASAPDTLLLDERLGPPSVQVEGNLASVWVYYEFWINDRFSHCGADLFTLGRVGNATGSSWKVIFVADSRRRADCAQNLPKGS